MADLPRSSTTRCAFSLYKKYRLPVGTACQVAKRGEAESALDLLILHALAACKVFSFKKTSFGVICLLVHFFPNALQIPKAFCPARLTKQSPARSLIIV